MDRPRLVALDLDGTLLRSDGSLSERTRRALKLVAAAGVELVVVTARPPRYVAPIAAELELGAIALCANGAIEYDLGTGRWRAAHPVPEASARRAVDVLDQAAPGVGFGVETGDRVVYEPGFVPGDSRDIRVPVADREAMFAVGRPIVKLLARTPDRGADELLAAARAALDEVECTHSGGRGLLEISAPGVSKVAGLAGLCASRSIASDQVWAFGDMPNDLAMLRWAGTGFAVANAHPDVLTAVTRHIGGNDDDGVAAVLESLV